MHRKRGRAQVVVCSCTGRDGGAAQGFFFSNCAQKLRKMKLSTETAGLLFTTTTDISKYRKRPWTTFRADCRTRGLTARKGLPTMGSGQKTAFEQAERSLQSVRSREQKKTGPRGPVREEVRKKTGCQNGFHRRSRSALLTTETELSAKIGRAHV